MKLSEIRKLCDEATPGPWRYDHGNWAVERYDRSDYHRSEIGKPEDGEFIAAARTLMPKLLAIAEAAHAYFALGAPYYEQEEEYSRLEKEVTTALKELETCTLQSS